MSNMEWKCQDCNKRFNGNIPFQQHMESAEHKKVAGGGSPKKSPENETLHCKFCDKSFNSVISYIDHVRSRDHLKMIKIAEVRNKAELLQKFREIEESNIDRGSMSETFVCPECGKTFSSWTNADDHFRSSAHIRKISENEMELTLYNMKPKIVNDTARHPLPSIFQNDANKITNRHNVSNQSINESVKDNKVNDPKDQGRQEKKKYLLSNKVKTETRKVVSGQQIIHHSSTEASKNNENVAALKEQISKPYNAKGFSKKMASKDQKDQEKFPKTPTNIDNMQPNDVIRSSRGIAYFIPSEPTHINSDTSLNTPALNKECETYRYDRKTKKDSKCRKSHEEINLTRPRNQAFEVLVSSNESNFHVSKDTFRSYPRDIQRQSAIDVPLGSIAEASKRYKSKATTKNVELKDNRKQKHRTENPNNDMTVTECVILRKGHTKINNLSTTVRTTKNCSKFKSHESSNLLEEFNGVQLLRPNLPSNKGKKTSGNFSQKDELEKKPREEGSVQNNRKEKARNFSINTKTRNLAAASQSLINKHSGQCENCGHPYFVSG